MRIPVFLSYPKPFIETQSHFVHKLSEHLVQRGLEPVTLGVTDYDMEAPLAAIRRLMKAVNGVLTVAFRRYRVDKGFESPNPEMNRPGRPIEDQWFTSPWSHIEPAMAYQLGLPVLILREHGVREDGVLEKGIVGTYMPAFDPADARYFESTEWSQLIARWEGHVRTVCDRKGRPPKLY